ncbi:MAG: glutamate--tRNA ligase [Oscillospiraceae bacterium]|nr:glutamate--tRNA ligase [Oscillospiraceae bacterium]
MTVDRSYFAGMEAKIPHGKVRTRFAPSPTGYMHVGNLRTALYTWLIARSHGGTFILRIEDTDQGRLVDGAVDVIYRTMAECGLTHDEGPDVGGPVAPYIQSQRRDTYGKYAHLLVELGHAYYCFCEKTESEEDSGAFNRAADPCRDLTADEVKAKLDAGMPYVIRQRIPVGTTTFRDAIFGDITVDNATLDDQVLLKRDGLPTYNFANVIDDHLMGITHVVRGSEYLSSAPKYNLLYQAFGWDVPTYVHCSPVMRDAQNKMSKRHGDPSYEDLKAEGYLTEAILNYVALLGWSPKGELAEQEIFSLPELVKAFDITGISKSPAIFDRAKLDHFNAVYLRALSPEDFHKAALPYIRQAVKGERFDTAAIAALLQARCEKLTDIPEKLDFFDELPEYDVEFFTNKKSKTNPEICRDMLRAAIPALEALPDWNDGAIHDTLISLAEHLGVKNATLMWPVRIAAAGRLVTPGGAVEICRILGREETLRRLALGLGKLEA